MPLRPMPRWPYAGLLVGGLLLSAGEADAVPVSASLNYTCVFPLIEEQPLSVDITSDMPAVIPPGQPTGAFQIQASAQVSAESWNGLSFVGTRWLAGQVAAQSSISGSGVSLPLTIPMDIAGQDLPTETGAFAVSASGSTPSLVFTSANTGEVEIRVGDLVMSLEPEDSNGNPTGLGNFESECTLNAEEDNLLHTLIVAAIPPDPTIDINPGALDFGKVQIGLSKELAVEVRNTGSSTLGITDVSLVDNAAADFILAHDCASLASQQQCQVKVTFAPAYSGEVQGELLLESNDPNNPRVAIPLSAVAEMAPEPEIQLSPQSLSFGSVPPGEVAEKTVLITNDGTATLIVSGMTITGTDAREFQQSGSCSAIPENQSCEITVRFAPVSTGNKQAALAISSNDANEPVVSLGLSGDSDIGTSARNFQFNGETRIKEQASLALAGQLQADVEPGSGVLSGQMNFDPADIKVSIIRFFKTLSLEADALIQPAGDLSGSLNNGYLTLQQPASLQLKNTKLTLFGFPLSQGSSNTCTTAEPILLSLSTPDDGSFDMESGGRLAGQYTMPPFTDCGVLTELINLFLAGPGNTVNVMLKPEP